MNGSTTFRGVFWAAKKKFVQIVLDRSLKYFRKEPDLEGCILAYRELKAVERGARIIEDHPCFHFKIATEISIFRPIVQKKLKATVINVHRGLVTCHVHRCFNARVENRTETILNPGDEILLKVQKLEVHRKLISIFGRFLKILKKSRYSEAFRSHFRMLPDVVPEHEKDSGSAGGLPESAGGGGGGSKSAGSKSPKKRKKKFGEDFLEEIPENSAPIFFTPTAEKSEKKRKKRKTEENEENFSGISKKKKKEN